MKAQGLALPAVLLAAMLSASAVGYGMKPHTLLADVDAIDLERAVPQQFGEWTYVPEDTRAIIDPGVQKMIDSAYSQLVSRSYVDAHGYRVMLAIAYGRDQRGAQMAHLPNVCYPAQGFQVEPLVRDRIDTDFGAIAVDHMMARLGGRLEPVTFWLTEGDTALHSAMQRRMVAVRYGMKGLIPDGMLFRLSSIDAEQPHAYERQAAFVRDMVKALAPGARLRIAGLR